MDSFRTSVRSGLLDEEIVASTDTMSNYPRKSDTRRSTASGAMCPRRYVRVGLLNWPTQMPSNPKQFSWDNGFLRNERNITRRSTKIMHPKYYHLDLYVASHFAFVVLNFLLPAFKVCLNLSISCLAIDSLPTGATPAGDQ